MRLFVFLLTWAGLSWAQQGACFIRGKVVDAQNGEPLVRVRVHLTGTLLQTNSDSEGKFEFSGLVPGLYTLQLSTVGYRLSQRSFTLEEGEGKEFEFLLSPDSFRRIERLDVRADPFEPLRPESTSELTLMGAEMKNLASVLADDPLRAVHSLPGVSSNDDFDSRFSLHGADYNRIGLYLDDILLHQPFHTVEAGARASGTLTIFNADTIDSIGLHTEAYPSRFGDRTAGALDVRTREGSTSRFSVRGTASASNAGVLAEGPLGRAGRGSWMASARKSYLQYIIRRTSSDPTLAGGFHDIQGKAAYDIARGHHVSLTLIDGRSGLDLTEARPKLGINSIMIGQYHFTLASAAWRYAPSPNFALTNRAAFLSEKFENANRDELTLAAGRYGEWTWNSSGTWMWSGGNSLDFGASVRRRRDSGYWNLFQFNPAVVRQLESFEGHGIISGGFAQQSASFFSGRLNLSAGIRADHDDLTRQAVASPRASVSLLATQSTRLQIAWGEYAQFPDLRWMFSSFGRKDLQPERATHYSASLEQRIGNRSRLRVGVYQRQDRDLLFRPFMEPRIVSGQVFNPPPYDLIQNSVRGYARGAEIVLQSRTANKLTGWISYSLGYTHMRDGASGVSFPSDFDQRHTVNAYGSYRVRPTINLSLKWLYGSGFPVPGFFRTDGTRYFLSESRNVLRVGSYQRTDVRLNKAFIVDRWKITLFAEVVNLFNRANRRYDSFNGYNSRTGQAFPHFEKMFPILPSAGIAFEF